MPPSHQIEPTENNVHNSHLNPETPEAEPMYTANTSRYLKLGRKDAYSVEEDAMIIKLRESDHLSWIEIANQISGRTPVALQARYNNKLRSRPSDARRLAVAQGHVIEAQAENRSDRVQVSGVDAWWDQKKDRSLLHLRDVCHLHWHEMAPLFPNHSEVEVERRYNEIHPKEIRKRNFEKALATPQPRQLHEGENPLSKDVAPHRFTPMEDAQIIRFREVDNLNWDDIAKAFPARNSLAIQRRYARILGPETTDKGKAIMRNNTPSVGGHTQRIDPQLVSLSTPKRAQSRRYGERENDTIMRSKANERTGWDQTATHLPGRAANSVKNRFEDLNFRASAEQYAGSIAMHVMPQVISSRPEAADKSRTPARQERPSRDGRMQSKLQSLTFSVPPQSVPPTSPETRSDQRTTNATAAEVVDLPHPPGPGHTTSRTRRLFTESEDNLIREMREEGQGFDKIAIRLPGRSLNSVWGRYNRVLNPDCEKKTYRCSVSAINSTPDKSRSGVSASKKRKSRQSLAGEEDFSHQASNTTKSLTVHAGQPPPITNVSDELHNAIDSRPGAFEVHYPPAAPQDWLYCYNEYSTQSMRQQPIAVSKPVRESRRLEAPLLRKAIDNTMRRQSDFVAPANAALSFPRTIFHGPPGQSIWLDEDSTSDLLLSDGRMLPAPRPLLQNSLDLPSIPDVRRNDQALRAPGRLFSLEQYRQLAAVVNNLALQHGKPHWMAKVKQIYEQDPSDSRLESLLEIATTDFIFPSQRPRIFEDTLASSIEQRHQIKLSHTPVRTLDESRMSEMESLNNWHHTDLDNSTLVSRPAADAHQRPISRLPEDSTVSAAAVSPAQSLLQITMPHNLFKNKITNDFNPTLYGEQVADEADFYAASQTQVSKLSKAPRNGMAVTTSVQSLQPGTSVGRSKKDSSRAKRQTDNDDVGRTIPVVVSPRAPELDRNRPAEAPRTRGRASGVSTTSPKKKVPVQNSAQVESETPNYNRTSRLEKSAEAPQAKAKGTKRKRAPPRATATSTLEDQQVATTYAKLPTPPRTRTRAQHRSQLGVVSTSTNTRSNISTDHRTPADGRLTIENSEDDEEILVEEDTGGLRPLKKQLVMPVEATTSPSRTTASGKAAKPFQDTNSSPSRRRNSNAKTQICTTTTQAFRQAAPSKATSTPAASTVPSKTLPTPATSVQTPSKTSGRQATFPAPTATATSGFRESARVAMRRQSRLPSARPSTPTKIINHRVIAATPLPARSDACKRVVQTPMRDLRADDSEDELA